MISQKTGQHTITIGINGGPAAAYKPKSLDSASRLLGFFGENYVQRYDYGDTYSTIGYYVPFEFANVGAGKPSGNMYTGFVNGRAFQVQAAYNHNPLNGDGTIGNWFKYQFSQDVSAQLGDEYTFSMTQRGWQDVPAAHPAGVMLGYVPYDMFMCDGEALYMMMYRWTTVDQPEGRNILKVARMPFDGGDVTLEDAFTLEEDFFFDQTTNYSSVATYFSGSSFKTFGIVNKAIKNEIGVITGWITKWALIDWVPGGDYTITYIDMSDVLDEDIMKGDYPGVDTFNADAYSVFGNKDNWLVTINVTKDGSQVKKYYQFTPSMSTYRELIFVGDTEAAPYLAQTGTWQAVSDFEGHMILFSASYGTNLGSPTLEMPEEEGPVGSSRIRSWSFSLDGHDFYVLRLGVESTFVYDTVTGVWYDWASAGKESWSVETGFNWLGGRGLAETSVVVGSDTDGQLYFLDPEQPYDEADEPEYFERIAMSQIVQEGRKTLPCDVIYLNADNNADITRSVTLYTSDDGGKTFLPQGTQTVRPGDYSQEFSWRSLGLIKAPGRLFKIVDDGAFTRIDNLEVNDGR